MQRTTGISTEGLRMNNPHTHLALVRPTSSIPYRMIFPNSLSGKSCTKVFCDSLCGRDFLAVIAEASHQLEVRMESGIETAMISVLRQLPRKMSTMAAVRRPRSELRE